jgi:hypothetical protein
LRPVIFRAVVPVFVSVTVCTGLVIATDALLKVRLLGEKLTVGGVLVPVPERLTVWGLLASLSVMVIEPARAPLADGVKVTLIVQLALAASVDPQVVVFAKSPALAPESAMLVMFKAALPELVRVAV